MTKIETDADKPKMKRKKYEKELRKLQTNLCLLQEWVKHKGVRAIVVFEGRDAAGKGGVIKAITERVSPRVFRVVALPAPSDREKTQMEVGAAVRAEYDAATRACMLELLLRGQRPLGAAGVPFQYVPRYARRARFPADARRLVGIHMQTDPTHDLALPARQPCRLEELFDGGEVRVLLYSAAKCFLLLGLHQPIVIGACVGRPGRSRPSTVCTPSEWRRGWYAAKLGGRVPIWREAAFGSGMPIWSG